MADVREVKWLRELLDRMQADRGGFTIWAGQDITAHDRESVWKSVSPIWTLRQSTRDRLEFPVSPDVPSAAYLDFGLAASSARCFCQASYSGVPGLGGTSLGMPPSHVGMCSAMA